MLPLSGNKNERFQEMQTDCIVLPSSSKKGVQSCRPRSNGHPKNFRNISHEYIQHV